MPDTLQLMDDNEWQEIRAKLGGKFDKMMKALFRQKGAQLDIDILASDEAQDFITTHAGILDSSFEKVEMSDLMRERLTRSDYIFSGMKAFHEMNEAFPSLLDDSGERKPFERFLNDVRKLDETYNAHYLHAEYNFVHASAQMAAKWEEFEEDGDRYYLQYRTQHDDKVRPEHAALDRVTLPMSDPFWESYYPPNGWNCRCTVAQVLKWKYEKTDSQEAMNRGKEALDGEKYNIFKFNSGKQGKAMPDYNPYTIKRCNDCSVAKGGNTKLAFVPESDLCAACKVIHQAQENRRNPRLRREEYNRVLSIASNWANDNLDTVTINGQTSKRTTMKTSDNHTIFIGKKFFSEAANKAKNDPKLAHFLKVATELKKWLPDAARTRIEDGYDHPYQFSVYRVRYQEQTIEFKCKMTNGEILYTMKIME